MSDTAHVFLGIDPGFTGAIAAYRPKDGNLRVYDMPTITTDTGKRRIDTCHLRLILQSWKDYVTLAVIEEVGAGVYVDARGQRRGQGASASFAFGRGYGEVLGLLAGLYIPSLRVRPGVWKPMLKLNRDKNTSLELARKEFPGHAHYFARKKDDGRAEAALLALFAEKKL